MARGKVLVADDNPDISRLVDVNLKFEGYETCLAFNGEEAIEVAVAERPDAIVLDIMLPRLDGWQVLKILKARPETRDIPVVLLTGMSLQDRQDKELVESVAHYVSKPFNPLRLIEIINDVVVSHGPAPEAPPRQDRLRAVVVSSGRAGTSILQSLLGNERIELVAVVDTDSQADGARLAQELNIPFYPVIESVPLYGDEVVIDTGGVVKQLRRGEVVRGPAVDLLEELLVSREQSVRKERTLVSELNKRIAELSILGEMAEVLSGSFHFGELCRRVLALMLKVHPGESAALLVYDDDTEKFVPRMGVGLPPEFDTLAQASLFDPLVKEMLNMRRPLVIDDLDPGLRSCLVTAVRNTTHKSMVMLPMVVKDKLMGLLVVYAAHSGWSATETQLLSTLAGQAAIAIDNVHLYEATHQKQAQVEQLLGRVIQAQEEERKRVAAEIHDSIAQTLVGMLTLTQTAQSLLEVDTKATARQLDELKRVIGDSVKEIRQIIFNLRPSSLDDLGLVLCLQNYVKRYEREQRLSVTLEISEGDRRLPPALETTVFRLVQESLTNVKKHALASRVLIRISIDPTHVGIRVADDGQGFEWREVSEKFLRGDTHGLEGMKERAAMMGGKLNITSRPRQGTVVDVEIPIERTAVDGGGKPEDA